MGLPASVVQQLEVQQEADAGSAAIGCVFSVGPQQLDPQQEAALSVGAPNTCKAVRAYLALTSCRNCSSFEGTFCIDLFLSIVQHEKRSVSFSLAFP